MPAVKKTEAVEPAHEPVAPAPTPDPSETYDDSAILDELFQDVRLLCGIRIEDLFTEMLEQTERSEILARKHAETVNLVEGLDTAIKRRKAEIVLECKARSPKPSEKEIDAIRDIDPTLNELRLRRGTAKAMKTYMDDMHESFRDGRTNMLINLQRLMAAEGNVKG